MAQVWIQFKLAKSVLYPCKCTVYIIKKKIISIGAISGKVTDIKANLTDEERMLMQMNKEKRAKYLAKKAAATA